MPRRNGFADFLDLIEARRCLECRGGRREARPQDAQSHAARPFCRTCFRRLPFWRRIDGCPVCGDAIALPHELAPQDPTAACPACLSRGSALHVCDTLLRYEGTIRRWLPAFKNTRSPFGPPPDVARAIDFLAAELARRVGARSAERPHIIAPIPLHARRESWRGFNHAWPLAETIARELRVPIAPRLLERHRATPPQASLNREARASNLRGAFRCRPLEADARVWLVDDVLTTGSTLEAAADAVLEAGALEVRALTLAATLPARRARIDSAVYSPAS